MRWRTLPILAFGLLLLCFASEGLAAKRVALVIGNDDYEHVDKLQKAVNDARAIAETLQALGFEVIRAENVTRREMNRQLLAFGAQLEPGDEAMFFFAGHGVEIDGRNYLLPTDIPSVAPGQEDFVQAEAIPADQVLDRLRARGTRISILVIDACRDNPFPKAGTRSLGGTRGLARMQAPEGSFIMFSAGIGQTALDRLSDEDPDPNSVFTRSLLPLLKKPGASLVEAARTVRSDVQKLAATIQHDQRPAYYDEVTGQFFFTRGDPGAIVDGRREDEDFKALQERLARLEAELKAKADPARPDQAGEEAETQQAALAPSQAATALAVRPEARMQSLRVKVGSVRQEDGTEASILGLHIVPLTEPLAESLGLGDTDGALVVKLADDAPAKPSGVQPGDVVRAFDGETIKRAEELVERVRKRPGGTEADLEVWRSGDGFDDLVASLRSRAEGGEEDAIKSLAFLHLKGAGTLEFENTESAKWQRKAADLGEPDAMFSLGYLLAEGRGLPKDEREAANWYRKAAEEGHASASYNLASMYQSGLGVAKDQREALRWYRQAAEKGDVGAMIEAGRLYEYGPDVPVDLAEAARFYRQAAEAGNAEGMVSLGVMYEHGRGVPKDAREAVRWYRDSAMAGHTRGMNNLGVAYEQGRGVSKDQAEAVRWYRQAAEKGNIGAMANLGVAYGQGLGVATDERQAADWFFKAADKGDPTAFYGLARAHSGGFSVAKDQKVAADYMLKALRSGYDFAHKEMTTNAAAWGKEFRMELQRLMRDEGVYSGPIDGSFGPGTRRAIEALTPQ